MTAVFFEAVPWPQITGAIAGGLVGAFAGFVVNSVLRRADTRDLAQRVGSALMGEIGALCGFIESYLAKLPARAVTDLQHAHHRSAVHSLRGERDYMPVFRSLGHNIGLLPGSLVRDLVYWYTAFAVCLERARHLHELSWQGDPTTLDLIEHAVSEQRSDIADLLERSSALLKGLSRL